MITSSGPAFSIGCSARSQSTSAVSALVSLPSAGASIGAESTRLPSGLSIALEVMSASMIAL